MVRIKGLFSSSNDKQFSDDDFEEDFEEDEAEDYKTYLERQRHEEQLRKEENYTIAEDFDEVEEDEEEYEEKSQGFFNRLKERLFRKDFQGEYHFKILEIIQEIYIKTFL